MRHASVLFALALPSLALADDGTGNETCEVVELPECVYDDTVLLPDLMTVVPTHLSIQNEHQTESLRFSNGLANLGAGPWWLEPEFPNVTDGSTCQAAYQVIAGADDFAGAQLEASDEEIPGT